jgi:hypothetical protein
MRRRFLFILAVLVCCRLDAQTLGTAKPAGKEPTLSIGACFRCRRRRETREMPASATTTTGSISGGRA